MEQTDRLTKLEEDVKRLTDAMETQSKANLAFALTLREIDEQLEIITKILEADADEQRAKTL